jgi:hypothetical protein
MSVLIWLKDETGVDLVKLFVMVEKLKTNIIILVLYHILLLIYITTIWMGRTFICEAE